MPMFIEFPLEDGGSITIEVDEKLVKYQDGLIEASRGEDKLLAVADKTFDAAVETVRNAADVLINKMRSLHQAPDEIEVTFGLKATGELGGTFFVAKASMDANYTVKLKWSVNG